MTGKDPEGMMTGPTVGHEEWWTRLQQLKAKEPQFRKLLDIRLRQARIAN